MKLDFDSEKYLEEQSQFILQRVNAYDKLYLGVRRQTNRRFPRDASIARIRSRRKNQITSPPTRPS